LGRRRRKRRRRDLVHVSSKEPCLRICPRSRGGEDEGGMRRRERDMRVKVALGGVLQNQIVPVSVSEGRDQPGNPRVGEFLRTIREGGGRGGELT
jgi:hypothetical protein